MPVHMRFGSKGGSIFEDTNLLIHAAIDGKGVALCGLEMVQEHLESGRLTRLFEESFLSREGYYLVFPREALDKPLVGLFRDWLMEKPLKPLKKKNQQKPNRNSNHPLERI